jgi:hypothetical protein
MNLDHLDDNTLRRIILRAAQDCRTIPAAIERETRHSRFRDRCSRERVHPVKHDVGMLLDVVMTSRRRQTPAVLDAARRVLKGTDTMALRVLIAAVLEGNGDVAMRHRCERLLESCDTYEKAREVLAVMRARLRPRGQQ